MALESLALFALTEFLLVLSPGPAVLFVVAISMRQGPAPGFAASAGVVAGTAFYFALSALGVGALIVASHTLFLIVKWVGAAYLIVLGARLLWPLAVRLWRREGLPAHDLPPAPPMSGPRAFWKGFAVQLANPKTLMFFVALFPQFIDPAGNVALQFMLMGLVSAAIEMPVLMAYTLVSAASARWLAARATMIFEGAAGALLMGIGGALALARDRP